jgi:Spy/CpxP family protein refolding chaperone
VKKLSVKMFGAIALFGLLTGPVALADEGDDKKKPETPAPADPKADKKGEKRQQKQIDRFARRFGGGQLDRMKEQLGLTDAQVLKIREVYAQMGKDAQEAFKKMREEGGTLDRNKMREAFQARRKDIQKKMGEILTPEQQEKWKELQKNRGRGGRGGGPFGRGGNRGDMTKQLKGEALKALKMTTEEKAVLEPMIDSVLATRKLLVDQEKKRRDKFLQSVRETDDEAKLKEFLAKYRKERDEDKGTLKKAQAQLVEALTPVQEAKLVALNILD